MANLDDVVRAIDEVTLTVSGLEGYLADIDSKLKKIEASVERIKRNTD